MSIQVVDSLEYMEIVASLRDEDPDDQARLRSYPEPVGSLAAATETAIFAAVYRALRASDEFTAINLYRYVREDITLNQGDPR
jgi:hypothetical protein